MNNTQDFHVQNAISYLGRLWAERTLWAAIALGFGFPACHFAM